MTPAIRIINARDPELAHLLTRQFSVPGGRGGFSR